MAEKQPNQSGATGRPSSADQWSSQGKDTGLEDATSGTHSKQTATEKPEQHGGDEHHAETVDKNSLPKFGTGGVALLAIVFAAVLVGLFLLGWLPRLSREKQLKEDAQAASDNRPTVNVAPPGRMPATTRLVLPGDAHALQETSIYPRANGYLKKLYVDIGDRVKANQLLAEIDTPEVDAQLAQARAALEQAKANADKAHNDAQLAQDTYQRYQGFAKAGGVTAQQLNERQSSSEQATAADKSAIANVTAAQAVVQRLEAEQGYEKVTAPFSGTITARNYDLGALLIPNNIGTGKELFGLAETDVLRIFVDVPQAYVQFIKPGGKATFEVRNYPGRHFSGTVVRDTGSVDLATRTLRYEVHFPNDDALLLPGMYGQVAFDLLDEHPPLTVPSSALVFASEGLSVVIVQDGRAHFQRVAVGRDFGTHLEVTEGLKGDEKIVTNPGARLVEGLDVRVDEKNSVEKKSATASAEPRPDSSKSSASAHE